MQKHHIFAVLVLAGALLAGTEAWTANNSGYVSDTLPAAMIAGVTYEATVTLENTGDTTWTDGEGAKQYDFGAWDGASPGSNRTWSNRVVINGSVAPGAKQTFTVQITAPRTNGKYDTAWGMVQEGVQWFGEVFRKTISVTGETGAVTALKATPQADGASCKVEFTLPPSPNVGGALVTINGDHNPAWNKDGPFIIVDGSSGQAVSCTFAGYTPGRRYYYSVCPFTDDASVEPKVRFFSWGPTSYVEATNLVPSESYYIMDSFESYTAGGAKLDSQGPPSGSQAKAWSIRTGSNTDQITVVAEGHGAANAVQIRRSTADAAVEVENVWSNSFHLSEANSPHQTFNPAGRCKLSFWLKPGTSLGGPSNFWAVTLREPEWGTAFCWVEGTDAEAQAFNCSRTNKVGYGSASQPISKETWHSIDVIMEVGVPNNKVYYYLDGAWFWTGISQGGSNRIKHLGLIAEGTDTSARKMLIDDIKIGDAASPVNAITFPDGAPTGSYETATPTFTWNRYWWPDRVTGIQVRIYTSPNIDPLGNPTGTMIYDSGDVTGNATSHTISSAIPSDQYGAKLYVFERDKVQYAADDSRGGYQPWSKPGEFVVSVK